MGRSNTIEEQRQKNREFQRYINEQTKALNAMVAEARATLDQQINDYYTEGHWDDDKPICEGKFQHLTTVSEWSLDSVAKIVDTLRNSVFGKAPPPEGSTVSPDKSTLAQNFANQSEMGLLIATAAFTAIQGTLVTFTSKTETNLLKQFVTQQLAPGLTLFLCVIENQFQQSGFFKENTIIQNGYVFEVRFSVDQAGDLANFNLVQSYISQQNAIEEKVAQTNAAVGQLHVTDADFDAKYAMFTRHLEGFNSRINDLQKGIDGLRAQAALQPVQTGAPAKIQA